MQEPTFETIEHLVAHQEVKGSSVEVTFRCPDTGVEATTSGTVQTAQNVQATAVRSAKGNLWYSLRRAVSNAIYSALGSNTAGRIAQDVADKGLSGADTSAAPSRDEIRAAVVDAFRSVQSQFKWDPQAAKWVGSRSADTPFAKQLAGAPVTEKFDQGILARTLVEIVCADGEVTDEERAFFSQFVDPELGTVEELAQRERLSPAELKETTANVSETILMLAWASALCDEDLAEEEAARLSEIGAGLGVAADRLIELREHAQQFLFEQALSAAYPGGSRDSAAHAEAMSAAVKLGIAQEQAETIDAQFRKRNAIV